MSWKNRHCFPVVPCGYFTKKSYLCSSVRKTNIGYGKDKGSCVASLATHDTDVEPHVIEL